MAGSDKDVGQRLPGRQKKSQVRRTSLHLPPKLSTILTLGTLVLLKQATFPNFCMVTSNPQCDGIRTRGQTATHIKGPPENLLVPFYAARTHKNMPSMRKQALTKHGLFCLLTLGFPAP